MHPHIIDVCNRSVKKNVCTPVAGCLPAFNRSLIVAISTGKAATAAVRFGSMAMGNLA